MGAVGFRRQPWQQRVDRDAHVAHHAKIDRAAAAEVLGAQVDLCDLGVARVELPVGEVGAQHEQQIALHHGVIAGTKADQPGHAHVERVVPFDTLLAAQCMDDRRLERVGKPHQRGVVAETSPAAQQGHAVGVVQELRQLVQLAILRAS